MNNTYIPSVLKEKLSLFINYFYGLAHLLFSIFLTISLLSFDINDNSFLTQSNQSASNLGGEIGSYISSFVFYTFGLFGYALIIFFLSISSFAFLKKKIRYLFLRLFLFFISLVLIPQTFLYINLNINFLEPIEDWGIVSKNLYLIYQHNYISYFLTFIGIILFIACLNIHQYLKLPSLKIPNFAKNENKTPIYPKIKKEPIISQIPTTNINKERISENKNIQKEFSKSNFSSPSLDILENEKVNSKRKIEKENIEENSNLLEKVFKDFNIEIKVMTVKLGPVVTLYEILPAAGTKINTIINLAGDISRSMGVGAVRIAQIYGTQFLGVEIPNKYREVVTIKELLSDNNFKNSEHKIPICIGKDISGSIEVIDLSKTPHLLVAGTTGSGKSVFINTLLTSLLYKFSPEQLRLILIDPKMLELSVYNDIAHLLTPVVTEPKKAIITLKWVCKEMERRYSLMNEENTRSLEGYNQKALEKLPYIIVFIDEMADLMMTAGKEVEHYVQRLAQMARACGIHLVMATQRPSVDIITGSIKANFPSRISFQVASKYDSRTVLGESGAEQLLGNGDMLMSKNGASLIRYQSAFISDNEVNKLIQEIKNSQKVQYLEELDEIINNNEESFDNLSEEDEALITKSIDLIKSSNKASTSFLQRNFQIGYNKAARIMEALEQRGVVSTPNHTGKREILINN
jgi:DNA segregation ATPase FtsK/SpoIIIE, S-DNA-T family